MQRSKQRGIATMGLALIILFLISVIGYSLNRNTVVEIQSSANQYLHTQAFEAAQSGLETALAALNDKVSISNFCATTDTFRQSCIRDSNADGLVDANSFSGTLGSQSTSGRSVATYTFSVTNPISGNFKRLRVSSIGCADGCSPCSSNCPVRSTLVQEFYDDPASFGAVNSQRDASVTGNTAVTGDVIAGNQSTSGASASISGALVSNDPNYSSYSEAQFFYSFFGDAKANLIAKGVTISSGNPNQAAWDAVTNNNMQSAIIYLSNTSVDITGGSQTIGSPTHPVIIIAAADLHLAASVTVYGMVYASNDYQIGAGGGTIIGLEASGRDTSLTGTGTIQYSQSIIDLLTDSSLINPPGSGTSFRILGGWRDY
jgi:Tfp pilus assembly protein PilX